MREWVNYVEAFWKIASMGVGGQEPCARTLLGHQPLCFRTHLHPDEPELGFGVGAGWAGPCQHNLSLFCPSRQDLGGGRALTWFSGGAHGRYGVESPPQTPSLLLLSILHHLNIAPCGPPLTLPDSSSVAPSDLALGFGGGGLGWLQRGLGCRQGAPVDWCLQCSSREWDLGSWLSDPPLKLHPVLAPARSPLVFGFAR